MKEEPKPQFRGVWIPKVIWEAQNITWMEKCLLAEIDALDDGDGCWAGNDYLAKRMGSSAASVANQVSKLRGLGYIFDVTFNGRVRRLKAAHSPEAQLAKAAIRASLNPTVNPALTAGLMQHSSGGEPCLNLSVNIDTKEDSIEVPAEKSSSPAGAGVAEKAKTELSEDGYKFADWFKTLLPAGHRLESSWRTNWAKLYDDLLRLDHRTKAEVVAVCEWARRDNFWSANFLSPMKLRQKDRGGVCYFDAFRAKMTAPKSGKGQNGHPLPPPKILTKENAL